MQNYINWLKNCIDGIKNVNLGDVSGYGQALYWQLMLLGTIILTLIIIAAVFSILGAGPFLYIKKQKQRFIAEVELVKQKLCGVKQVNFDDEKNFIVQINLSGKKMDSIAKKYVKRCSRIVAIALVTLTFLIFPLFMEFTEKITIPSLIGGIAFILIVFFVFADFLWFIIYNETMFFSIFDSILKKIAITLKHDVPGHKFNWFILGDFTVEVLNASDNFTESVLCQAMDDCILNLELNDKSFEDNIDNFYIWMNKFVIPKYESLIILTSQKTDDECTK